MTYDHIKFLPNAGYDWRPVPDGGPPRYDWDSIVKNWNLIESILETEYKYDVFAAAKDTYLRSQLVHLRHKLLLLEVTARLDPSVKEASNYDLGRIGTVHLEDITREDVDQLRKKDADYGSSWKRRGGIGAFMCACRKYDRLEQQIKKHDYDIHRAMRADRSAEGIADDVGDLRRYLILFEAEILAMHAGAFV